MKTKKTISIVMPYYNQPDVLRFTLPFWRHFFPKDEIIIIDDGSTQKASSVVKSLGISATVIYQKKTGYGCAKALNLGWRSAHSDRILFTNCDIIPNFTYKSCLELYSNQIRCFLRNECREKDIPEILNSSNIKIATQKCIYSDVRLKMGAIQNTTYKPILPVLPIYCYGFGLSIPKYMIESVGGFCEEITSWGGEDLLLCLQIEDKFPKVVFEIDIRNPVLHLETKDEKTKRIMIKSYYKNFPSIAKKYLSSEIFSKYKIGKLGKTKSKN